MAEDRQVSVFRYVLNDLPGAMVACVGFGLFLLSIEATRLPAIHMVSISMSGSVSSLSANVLSLGVIVVLYGVFRKRFDAVRPNTLFTVLFGFAMSASLFLMWGQTIIPDSIFTQMLGSPLFNISCAVLFFCWVKVIYPHGALVTAVIFAFSIIVSAFCNATIAFVKAEAVAGVVALLPVISTILLCGYRKLSSQGFDDDALDDADKGASFSDDGLSPEKSGRKRNLVVLISLALSLFCYAFVFGYIHSQWVMFQDNGTLSFIMQMGIASGGAVAGIIILLIVRKLWSHLSLLFYMFVIVTITILALWLMSFVQTSFIFSYLALLNVAQKSVFFFIVVAPFMILAKGSLYRPWALTYLAFEAGKTVSAVMLGLDISTLYGVFSVVAVAILFVCGTTMLISEINRDKDQEEESAVRFFSSFTPPTSGNRFKKACLSLAEDNHLTERETDALILLARGRNADYVAESMVISPQTAKVYARNVYAKLNVHKQQDLISLVEERIDDQKAVAAAAQREGR